MAARGRGALRARSRAGHRARAPRAPRRHEALPRAARRDDGHAWPGGSALGNARSGGTAMNWPSLFLGCFVIGFLLSALSFALGAVHAHLHIHVPWGHHLHGNVFHGGSTQAIGPINFATLTAFLAWFGGTGYLLTTEFRWLAIPAVLLSIVVGLIGSGVVFWVMAHVLWSPDENMQSADYHMVGVLGTVTQPIR